MIAIDEYYISNFYLTLNQIFIDGESIDIKTITSRLGESTRSLNRHMLESCGYTPMHIINVVRFYSAFTKLQKGESIEDTQYLIKIDSKSYFYKMFKKFHKIKPSEVKKVTNNLKAVKDLEKESSLSCNIESYKYYKENLNEELAHLLSHEDFKDITYDNVNLEVVKDTFWRYKHLSINTGGNISYPQAGFRFFVDRKLVNLKGISS